MIFDKQWWKKRKIKRRENCCVLNDRGKYSTYYYINRYINSSTDENIEAYDANLEKIKTGIDFQKLYSLMFSEKLLNKEDEIERQNTFAALIHLSITLFVVSYDEGIDILEQIDPNTVDDFIKWFINFKKNILKI